MLILSPSCFAVCGHHLSPRIAIVFSLLCSLPNSSMLHPSNFVISSSNASRSSLYISRPPTLWVLLSVVVPHGHIFAATSSPSRLLAYLFLLSGRSRPSTRIAVSAFSEGGGGVYSALAVQSTPLKAVRRREGGGGVVGVMAKSRSWVQKRAPSHLPERSVIPLLGDKMCHQNSAGKMRHSLQSVHLLRKEETYTADKAKRRRQYDKNKIRLTGN